MRTNGLDADDPPRQRAIRLALLLTIRDLRQSVAHGRPITLPNLVRLLKRRLNRLQPNQQFDAPVDQLQRLYRIHQPFGRQGIQWRV